MTGDVGNLVVEQCSAVLGGDLPASALVKVISSQRLRTFGSTRFPDGHS